MVVDDNAKSTNREYVIHNSSMITILISAFPSFSPLAVLNFNAAKVAGLSFTPIRKVPN